MKNKFLVFFVVGIMAITTSHQINAQNVEEYSRAISAKKVENMMRFTLEVQQDSSLCSGIPVGNECYLISKTFKKYVYVDVSKSKHITADLALACFNYPNSRMMVCGPVVYTGMVPSDFTVVEPSYTLCSFPWVAKIKKYARGYYYVYNKSHQSNRIDTVVPIDTEFVAYGEVLFLWILFLLLAYWGLRQYVRGINKKGYSTYTFVEIFQDIWPVALSLYAYMFVRMAFNFFFVYPVFFGLTMLLFHKYILKFLRNHTQSSANSKLNRDAPRAQFYFFFSLGILLSLIFFLVGRLDLMYYTLPIIIFIIFYPFLWKKIFKKIYDFFEFIWIYVL